jgi:hypothetical protein
MKSPFPQGKGDLSRKGMIIGYTETLGRVLRASLTLSDGYS